MADYHGAFGALVAHHRVDAEVKRLEDEILDLRAALVDVMLVAKLSKASPTYIRHRDTIDRANRALQLLLEENEPRALTAA